MSSTAPCDRYRRNDDIVTREILGETLLVPISSDIADMSHIFALNDTGAWVWQQLDGRTPLAGIRDSMTAEFDVAPAAAWDDLARLVDELAGAGLVRRVE